MTTSQDILLSRQVLKTLRELPENKRTNVARALVYDLILGEESAQNLPDFDYLIYSMIAESIRRDSYKHDKSAV